MLSVLHTKNPILTELIRIAASVAGAVIYAVGVNLFIVPLNLYNGGVMGICQLIRTFLIDAFGLSFSFDIAGILFFIINIPILIAAWFTLDHKFVIRTLLNVVFTTLFLSVIPVKEVIHGDILTNCLVGGAVTGLGCGIPLWAATAGGGTDVIGFIMIKHNRNFTIGKINLIVDFMIYAVCMLKFNVQTAIYSILYAIICAIVTDKLHHQNINVEAIIVTASPCEELKQAIMKELDRGLTVLPARGGYTGDDKTALMIVISKYEVSELSGLVHRYDPDAFVTFKENTRVLGNFEKRM